MAERRLSVKSVRDAGPGKHLDGGGLMLVVRPSGSRAWVLRMMVRGVRREIGLGPYPAVSLAEARAEAQRLRDIVREGGDPLAERRAAADAIPQFGVFADAWLPTIEGSFRNAKHRQQWAHSLSVHCGPLRQRQIDEVTTDDVLAALTPIWTKHPETASRVRGRIERVLDAAKARGLRAGENPARWRGHLDNLLPRPKKLARGHHAAMPWRDVPDFYAALKEREAVSAHLLRFLILTAARSGEARGTRWDEVEPNSNVWTVPAERMKAGRPHRVPLTTHAIEIIEGLRGLHSQLIFPSPRGKVSSDMVFSQLYRRMGVTGVTTHGFRSSFRDWTNEAAHADFHVAELCLAHNVGSAVERAYARSDLLEQRRALLGRWAAFVTGEAAEVIPLPKRRGRPVDL